MSSEPDVLTKKDTRAAKGLAICLMFIHHLYYVKERLINGNSYIPVIPKYDIEYYLGNFGGICVAIFLYLSGYGLFKSSVRCTSLVKYIFNKVFCLYKVYWTVFLVFIPIGLLFYRDVKLFGSEELRYTADHITVVKNLLGLSSSFNGEWWFVRLYIVLLVVIFPLYRYLIEKRFAVFLIFSLFLYSLSTKIDLLENVLFWQLSFASGMIAAKYGHQCRKMLDELYSLNSVYIICFSVICLLIRFRFNGKSFDFILAPVFVLVSNRLLLQIGLYDISAYIGEYSFPMWLNHSFFCYYYFQDIVFWPKYSPLVFITLLVFSLLSAIATERMRSAIGAFINRRHP